MLTDAVLAGAAKASADVAAHPDNAADSTLVHAADPDLSLEPLIGRLRLPS